MCVCVCVSWHVAAGEMSGKSVTELVSNLRRPFEGEGHVWLATRGPGEFVGELDCFLLILHVHCALLAVQRVQVGKLLFSETANALLAFNPETCDVFLLKWY